MKKILTISFIAILFFSCSSDNDPNAKKTFEIDVLPIHENSSKVNHAIGITKDADLSLVFKTLNELHLDIRQMNGFVYYSNTPESGVNALRDELNQKTYIKTGAWSATPYSVFFNPTENKTMIVNSFFEMNVTNQTDLLNLISSSKWEDKLSDTKNIYLSIPEGAENHYKEQMKKYPFVKWTETFDQVCVSYQHTNVISANVPTSGNVNTKIPIIISFGILSGCGDFGSITETNLGNTKTITVKAKYEGCFCTSVIGKVQTTYNFTPTTTGTHTIKFLQPNGEFLTYTITVQ